MSVALELSELAISSGDRKGQVIQCLTVWRKDNFDAIVILPEPVRSYNSFRAQKITEGHLIEADTTDAKQVLLACRDALVERKAPLECSIRRAGDLELAFTWNERNLKVILPPSPEPDNDLALYFKVASRSVNELKELLVQRSRQVQAATTWMLNTSMLLRQSSVSRQEIEADLYEGVLNIMNGRPKCEEVENLMANIAQESGLHGADRESAEGQSGSGGGETAPGGLRMGEDGAAGPSAPTRAAEDDEIASGQAAREKSLGRGGYSSDELEAQEGEDF